MADVAGDPTAWLEGWNVSDVQPNATWFAKASIADLDGDGDVEIAVGRVVDLFEDGALDVYDSTGSLLWNATSAGVSAGAPLIADFEAGDGLEIFASYGKKHEMRAADGALLWTAETLFPTASTLSFPLAIDMEADGLYDVVQVSRVPKPALNPLGLLRQTPSVYVFDGATGRVLVEHKLPCGLSGTQLVGGHVDGVPTIFVGCRAGNSDYEIPGSTIQAIHVERGNLLDRLLTKLGIGRLPLVEVAWEYEVQDGTADLGPLVLANLDSSAGQELVALWTDPLQQERMGVTVLSQQGDLLFEHITAEEQVATVSLAVGDLDGDGLDELVFMRERSVQAWAPRADGLHRVWEIGHERDTFTPAGVSLGDVDADGIPEVLVGWELAEAEGLPIRARIGLYSGAGELLWEKTYRNFPHPGPIRDGQLVDITGDGRLDIVYPATEFLLTFTGTG